MTLKKQDRQKKVKLKRQTPTRTGHKFSSNNNNNQEQKHTIQHEQITELTVVGNNF